MPGLVPGLVPGSGVTTISNELWVGAERAVLPMRMASAAIPLATSKAPRQSPGLQPSPSLSRRRARWPAGRPNLVDGVLSQEYWPVVQHGNRPIRQRAPEGRGHSKGAIRSGPSDAA